MVALQEVAEHGPSYGWFRSFRPLGLRLPHGRPRLAVGQKPK
jgi:hypothetical protein